MKTNILFSLPPSLLRLGVVEAYGASIGPSRTEYLAVLRQETRIMAEPTYHFPDPVQKGIRSLLRSYGFHPSGRNRPASEFLVKDLQTRGDIKSINNGVDINNHISFISHLPISILDLDKTGLDLCIRLGFPDESYVFNQEGQELSLKNLLVVSGTDPSQKAFGSPVKDSQATKIFETTKNLIGIIYTSQNITAEEELQTYLLRFSDLLSEETNAQKVSWSILEAPSN